MGKAISASLIVLSVALSGPAFAQHEGEPVPMEKASFHVPIFSNDHIIMLNINIPPSFDSGYHTHYADSVSVNLSTAARTGQIYGSSEVTPAGSPGDGRPGSVNFTDVTNTGMRTHKASNIGPTPFHNISFILKHQGPEGFSVSDRSGAEDFELILDNARLRAWRVVLEPGKETGEITQTAPGLRVYVHSGVLAEMVPGADDRGMAPNVGDFIWQEEGQTRAVKNIGTSLIEYVEFEIK
jgi:hypothetical protein